MIDFSCRCGQRFSVAEQDAGEDLQCPACGLLNSVPVHSELPGLADDGTYHVDDSLPAEDTGRLRQMGYVFKKGTHDDAGNQIDLRNTPADLAQVGETDELKLDAGNPVGFRPRYDPETGELIVPLEMKPDEREEMRAADIPMATPALNYAPGKIFDKGYSTSPFIALNRPVNLMVMIIMFSVQSAVQGLLFVLLFFGMWFAAPMLMLIQVALFCHYGNVIDEIGPGESDELPRPLRDLRFHEDLWIPFTSLAGTVVICYLPAALGLVAALAEPSAFFKTGIIVAAVTFAVVFWRILWLLVVTDLYQVQWMDEVLTPVLASVGALAVMLGPPAAFVLMGLSAFAIFALSAVLGAIGTLFVPAVMLTIATSGSNANLRPDRVLAVMRTIGFSYIVPVIAWSVGAPAYLVGLTLIGGGMLVIGGQLASGWAGLTILAIDVGILFIAIYGMHVLAWQLGRIYREHAESFPWIYQVHTSTRVHRTAADIQRDIEVRKALRLQQTAARRSAGPR